MAIWKYTRWLSNRPHVTEIRLLLYDFTHRRLAEYPLRTEPGAGNTACLTLFARASRHAWPRAGMTLEDLEQAGLIVGWLYRVEPRTYEPQYADPDHPERWIGSGDPAFQSWMAARLEAAKKKAGGGPLIPLPQ